MLHITYVRFRYESRKVRYFFEARNIYVLIQFLQNPEALFSCHMIYSMGI